MRSSSFVARVAALAVLLIGVLAAGYSWFRHQAPEWRNSIEAGVRFLQPAAIEPIMSFPPELRESSGVAASTRNAGLLWTHNDSGNRPVVYGVRHDELEDGIVARISLDGASAMDWEDIALGPCPWSSPGSCLYVADIGDNFRRRSSVAVIVFEEPVVKVGGGSEPGVEWSEASLRYPDGPVNAEGLAVTDAGDLIVVTTEGDNIGRVFKLSRDEVAEALREGSAVLRSAGTVGTRWRMGVTAATWIGSELVVRTQTEIFHWRREGDHWKPARRPCFVGHAGRGGEGLDSPAPGVYYLTQEARGEGPAGLDMAVCAT